MDDASFKYYAFVSYSHQDKQWGDWLHKALETYRVLGSVGPLSSYLSRFTVKSKFKVNPL